MLALEPCRHQTYRARSKVIIADQRARFMRLERVQYRDDILQKLSWLASFALHSLDMLSWPML